MYSTVSNKRPWSLIYFWKIFHPGRPYCSLVAYFFSRFWTSWSVIAFRRGLKFWVFLIKALIMWAKNSCIMAWILYDQFKRLPQDISEPWLQWLKLIYHPSSITNNVSKNWSMTLKGLRGVVLRALIEKTPNFWPIEPIELKFWHLILIMECLKISLRGSHGSTFGPLRWP